MTFLETVLILCFKILLQMKKMGIAILLAKNCLLPKENLVLMKTTPRPTINFKLVSIIFKIA